MKCRMKNGLRQNRDDVMLLNDANEMNSFYINKPRKLIVRTLFRFFGWFFICALLSFHIFKFPMIPVWAYCIYKFYIGLKYFEKYNVSKCKVVIFSCFVIVTELIISIFVRKAIWFLFSRIL